MNKISLIVISVLSLSIFSGCLFLAAAAGGGGAGVREITDKSVVYQGDIESVNKAINKAIKELGATVKETVTESGEKGDRTIRGKTYDDEVLTIDMEPTSPKSTNVEVRVGRIGSKKRAEEFHKAIAKYAKPVTE